MPNPTAAFLVIGDEILSGRTREANVQVLATALAAAGIDLVEVRVIRDGLEPIVTAVNALRSTHDQVFTSGGIGPTHDDVTADSVAAAFGVPIDVRDDARAMLEELVRRRGVPMAEGILRMARIPDGAALIGNKLSGAPGFSLGNVHVMAGVPTIFAAMVEELVPTLPGGAPTVSGSLVVERGEAYFAAALAEFARTHDDLTIGSYPFRDDDRFAVEVVVRGRDRVRVDEAVARLAVVLNEA
ncbi:competence/damage-inducible protein A [Pseudonocardia humida]|uniref:Competence/damage-inducible protein A n=1 Tax=Pseudonocardia humida TaxID=2800819 RepID=A0ABT1ADH6_9PSEU|nr:molybdopterin-binding protein [Pseudonocardia humida]MCO1660951.1 competence/damage-inducible protein A [Pseudonocardia humida]